MYLGAHWSYRREAGETQLTVNYCRAFTDYIINFCISRDVFFHAPKETEAIVPDLLKRVWEVDNSKRLVLQEMFQQGGVSGDVFLKVAYEEPWTDTVGAFHPGKVRILVINPAHCFPEWHPHDKTRLVRFKLKYKFWGTTLEGTRQVYTYTEILTDDSIEEYVNDEMISQRENPLGTIPVKHCANRTVSGSPWGLSDIHDVTTLNKHYNEVATDIADIVNYHCVDAETEILTGRGWLHGSDLREGDDALVLDPDSNEVRWGPVSAVNRFPYDGELVHWHNHVDALTTPGHRWLIERRIGRDRHFVRGFATTSEGAPRSTVPTLQQGSRIVLGGGVPSCFPVERKWDDEFVETVGWWITEGSVVIAASGTRHGTLSQSTVVNGPHVHSIRRLAAYWRDGGHAFTERPSLTSSGCVTWYLGRSVVDALDAAGYGKEITPEFLRELTYAQAVRLREVLLDGDGTLGTGGPKANAGRKTWYQDSTSRRDAYQMLSAMLGMRTRSFDSSQGGVVDTYQRNTSYASHTVETATNERYVGEVWCPTTSTGTWLARRNGRTYWTGNSAPVTVITGAKANQLEKGPKKVWGGLPKEAQVFNLELGQSLDGPLAYLETIRRHMHEMVGVPETALGQVQPISNTSGVALSIQFQPLMNVWGQKIGQYGMLLEQVNELVLRTLALKEPETFIWDPDTEIPLKSNQLPQLDPADPLTYQTFTYFPQPLPIDKLIVLNEVQQMLLMGLESREGALRALGEEFPDEKLAEIRAELMSDAKADGALQLLKSTIASEIMQLTGVMPQPDGSSEMPPTQTEQGPTGNKTVQPQVPQPKLDMPAMVELQAGQQLRNELVTQAYGTKLPQRAPAKTEE